MICTHDRPELLERALTSLAQQTFVPDEIMVVDNSPPDTRTSRLVAQRFPAVRYICEPTQGLNFARNRALAETSHEIVAYLDDDAVADTSWLRSTVEAFKGRPNVAVCTARVRPLRLDTDAQRLFEAQGGFDRGASRIHMPRDASTLRMHGLRAPLIAWSIAIGVGAAMAVRRSTVDAIGGFDIALDLGAVLPGGGDVDLIWRMLDAGLDVVYEPAAVVLHEHRREMEQVIAQILGHRRAEIAFLAKSARAATGWKRVTILAFLGWRLMKPGLRLLRQLITGSDALPASLLRRLWLDSWRGIWTYDRAVRIANARVVRLGV